MQSVREKCYSIVKMCACALIVMIVLILIFCRGLLVSDQTAITALETQGYGEITITNRHWFFVKVRGGGEGDVIRFDCRATNPKGQEVEIHVFSGWPFKGATVRTP